MVRLKLNVRHGRIGPSRRESYFLVDASKTLVDTASHCLVGVCLVRNSVSV